MVDEDDNENVVAGMNTITGMREEDYDDQHENMGDFKLNPPLSNGQRTMWVSFMRVNDVVHVLFKLKLKDAQQIAFVTRDDVLFILLGACRSVDMERRTMSTRRHPPFSLKDDLLDHFRNDPNSRERLSYLLKTIEQKRYKTVKPSGSSIPLLKNEFRLACSNDVQQSAYFATKRQIMQKDSPWKEIRFEDAPSLNRAVATIPADTLLCLCSPKKLKSKGREVFLALVRRHTNTKTGKTNTRLLPLTKGFQLEPLDPRSALSRFKVFRMDAGKSTDFADAISRWGTTRNRAAAEEEKAAAEEEKENGRSNNHTQLRKRRRDPAAMTDKDNKKRQQAKSGTPQFTDHMVYLRNSLLSKSPSRLKTILGLF